MTPKTKQGRMQMRDEKISKLIDEGWEYNKIEDCGLIVLTHIFSNRIVALGFKGSSLKPWFHYRFSSVEKRIKFVQDRIDFLRKNSVSKSRKSPDASEHYMEGDVLYDSWGYDQTNIDWYQVTKVKGKSIWLRKIAENSSDAGNCSSGYTQPRRYEFTGGEFRKTVQPGGHVCSPLRGGLYKWDGKPKYCSSYH